MDSEQHAKKLKQATNQQLLLYQQQNNNTCLTAFCPGQPG